MSKESHFFGLKKEVIAFMPRLSIASSFRTAAGGFGFCAESERWAGVSEGAGRTGAFSARGPRGERASIVRKLECFCSAVGSGILRGEASAEGDRSDKRERQETVAGRRTAGYCRA